MRWTIFVKNDEKKESRIEMNSVGEDYVDRSEVEKSKMVKNEIEESDTKKRNSFEDFY